MVFLHYVPVTLAGLFALIAAVAIFGTLDAVQKLFEPLGLFLGSLLSRVL